MTSAPAIAKDLVITGSSIGDNRAVTLERGIVRAFDVRTGETALVVGSYSLGDEHVAAHRCRKCVVHHFGGC